MSGDSEELTRVSLRLGDIIEIEAPDDETLDNKQFIIRYIDNNLLRLENRDGEKDILIADGRLENDSISKISLFHRETHPGYAMQNGLLPGKRVTINFSTSTPFQINAQITALNNDQITLLTSEQRTIYIDFAYKGIPLDIPIQSIKLVEDEEHASSSPSSKLVLKPPLIEPSIFEKSGEPGDFLWEIKEDIKNGTFPTTLYIFNDNNKDHATAKKGGGNAQIRIFNKYSKNDPPRSAGISTGWNPGSRVGFKSLEDTKGVNTVKDIIDRDIGEIKLLIATGNYDKIKYSASDKSGNLGTSIFEVGDDVKKYIVDQIRKLGTPEKTLTPTPTPTRSSSPISTEEDENEASAPETPEKNEEDMENEAETEQIVFKSDDIVFGEDLGFVTQVVELPESEKRFHIDKQTDDIMNTMLSSIPNAQRDNRVLGEIHVMINRFKELRNEYSNFDETNNTISPKVYDSNYKPLVESIQSLDKKYYWMLPVATTTPKLYDVTDDIDDGRIKLRTTADARIKDTELNNKFIQNEMGYKEYLMNMRSNFTPFVNNTNEKQVNTPLTAVIDNVDGFKSSVVVGDDDSREIREKKFFTQDYILAQDMINPDDNDGIIKATPNDTINIKSFLTLPDSAVRFSRINAPSTDILSKTSLNDTFLQYSRILKENLEPKVVDVDVDSNKGFAINNFLEKITHYTPEDEINDPVKYRKYLENIVPSTSQLFREVQSHMEGTHSIRSTIRYLEPFAVEPSVITNSVHRKMRGFVEQKIKEFAEKLENNYRNLSVLSIDSADVISGLELMFETSRNIYDEIMDGYGITPDLNITDDEIYTRVMAIDNGRFLNIGIALTSVRLMILHDAPCVEDYQELAREKREENKMKINEETKESDECNKYVLSKKYLSLDELENDNNQEVFFDKRYDSTYYDLAKEYSIQLDQIKESKNQEKFLAEKLQEVNGLSEVKSMREARAMLRNKREVIDGEYAVLYSEDIESKYYRRENNNWVLDPNIDEDLLTDETKLFCNFNERCIQKDNTCNSVKNEQINIETEVEKQIIDEFETALKTTKDEHIKKIMKMFRNAKKNVRILRTLHQQERISVNMNNQVFFGEESSMTEVISSPYETLRNAILEQSDFAKKQSDIRRFILHFTRNADIEQEESPYWLYCIKTNVKLLPSFYREVSQSFVDGLDYMDVIGKICDERGELGDDGSVWVDKHSGYIITNRSFDAQEGYTEEGFRINTRAILDDEPYISENINNDKSYSDTDTLLIMRVIDDMEKFMGIHLEEQQAKEFIRRLVKESLRELQMNERSYVQLVKEESSKKTNKTFSSYKEYKNEMILSLSLSYLLIAIQTSIPQMKFGKQYPGCSRSFSGYPLDSDGTKGVEYISCVANKIKRSVEPWDTLSSANKLSKKIMKYLKSLVKKSEVKSRLENKRNYVKDTKNQINVSDELIISYSTSSLLPILIPVETRNIPRTPMEFYDLLDDDMKTAKKEQHARINAMQGKKIHVAVRMQHLIEKEIKNNLGNKALLTTAAEEPYVENACCWDDETRPFEYFSRKVPQLKELNDESKVLSRQLSKAKALRSARILFSPSETKTVFPKISSFYSEQTKYRALASLCQENDFEKIDDDESVCKDFDVTSKTLEAKIKELENNGLKYTNENVMDLVAFRNAKHIFDWKQDDQMFHHDDFSEEQVEFMKAESGSQIELVGELRLAINEYMKNNLKNNEFKAYLKSLEIISKTFESDKSKSNFDALSVSLNSLRYMCLIIPDLLTSGIASYSTLVPKHWQLSQFHVKDIERFAQKKATKIDKIINKISETKYELEEDTKMKVRSFYYLMVSTILETRNNDSIQNVFEYCLFSVLNIYIPNNNSSFTNLIAEMVAVVANEMNTVIYDYNDLERKINSSKEKEKMDILKRLENMTDEEREIDNEKKYNKLGDWGKGLQKNLRIYDRDDYDKERGILDTEDSGELTNMEQQEIDEIVMHDDDNPNDGEDGDEIY